MEEKLDKDFNPMWLCKTAGFLFPSLILIGEFVAAVVHKGRSGGDWILMGWCSVLLLAFWFRYQSDKVESAFWEFMFGAFLAEGPMYFSIAPVTRTRDWSGIVFFSTFFIVAAVKYVRRFYFPPARKEGKSGAQANC